LCPPTAFAASFGLRRLLDESDHLLSACEGHIANEGLVEPQPESVERAHVDPITEPVLVAEEPLQLGLLRMGQRIGERGQHHPRVGIRPGEVDGPVEGNDRLHRPG
jgi:hypothetical protein